MNLNTNPYAEYNRLYELAKKRRKPKTMILNDLPEPLRTLALHLVETKAELKYTQQSGSGRAGGWPGSKAWTWYVERLRDDARREVEGLLEDVVRMRGT